ncbi:MAG TPA: ribonuclease J [Patescibacteria group bacterium]|nr:ribonuclease J [Patescibacteria group bacterium]
MDNNNTVTFISIGGVGDVTKNMSAYIYHDEILLVDCGIGFANETTLGVDLVIPNITYLKELLSKGKRIVGLVLTHGHEDHIGAVPFITPLLPPFPIYGTTLTAELTNEKLKEFGEKNFVKTVRFEDTVRLGSFTVSFARVTHSIVDAANLFIRTPIGNFYHGSDFKFDLTPVDGKPSELRKIAKWGEEGIICTMSDCLGAEHQGHSHPEIEISEKFDEEARRCKGKLFITTYSSNISRMNQAIQIAKKYNRKVCFIGRSFLKVRDLGRKLKYMDLPPKMEIKPQDVRRLPPNQVMILLAGSQAQVESGLVRISQDQDRDIRINSIDTVIFSADPIPGNEVNINSLIDTLSKKEARVVYPEVEKGFHVSGHGFQNDLKLLLSLTNPKFVLPIGGTYRHMVAYKALVEGMGYTSDRVIFADGAREIIFTQSGFRYGKYHTQSNVYVDQLSGEAIDKYIIMDRQKIAEEGVLILVGEVSSVNGQLIGPIDVISRGVNLDNKDEFVKELTGQLNETFARKQDKVTNWTFYRKTIEQKAERILEDQGREPLLVPVVLES